MSLGALRALTNEVLDRIEASGRTHPVPKISARRAARQLAAVLLLLLLLLFSWEGGSELCLLGGKECGLRKILGLPARFFVFSFFSLSLGGKEWVLRKVLRVPPARFSPLPALGSPPGARGARGSELLPASARAHH